MVKGMSYTLEATLAGIIILFGLTLFFTLEESYSSRITPLKEEGFRCLKEIDDSGNLRSAAVSNDAAFIDDEVSLCMKSAINHEILICRNSCTAPSAPQDVEKILVDYYVAGYTDKDPAKITMVMWE